MARKTGSFGEPTAPRVRAAATRLIAAQGFAAVSMRQIAGEVGLQAGALYSYTPDKQTLLFELVRGQLETRLSAWQAEPPTPGPVEALEQFSRFHLRFLAEEADGAKLVRMELRNLTSENRDTVETLLDQYEGMLSDILETGSRAKLFMVPNAKLAAKAVLGLLDGVAAWAEDGSLPADRVARISWNMVRRSVGAKGYQ